MYIQTSHVTCMHVFRADHLALINHFGDHLVCSFHLDIWLVVLQGPSTVCVNSEFISLLPSLKCVHISQGNTLFTTTDFDYIRFLKLGEFSFVSFLRILSYTSAIFNILYSDNLSFDNTLQCSIMFYIKQY